MSDHQDDFTIIKEAAVPSRATGPDRFSGSAWQAEVLPATVEGGLRGHRFTYAPGAKSHWHVHSGEQALIVVSGRGLVQWEGLAEPREVGPGDWIHVRPGVKHWHGAADDTVFVHLAVTASGGTDWREPVSGRP